MREIEEIWKVMGAAVFWGNVKRSMKEHVKRERGVDR